MSRRITPSRQPSLGTMTVRVLGQAELRHRRRAVRIPALLATYEYASPANIAGSLAQFDRYTANAWTPADGQRRFLPRDEDGLEGYIARTFQIGHSLLARDQGWSKAKYDDYLLGKLAFDWYRHSRDRLKPRNLSADELVTPGHLQRELSRPDALPEELTTDDEERGSALVSRIAAAGAEAASVRGIAQPTETEILALGLMQAAARQEPWNAEPDYVTTLVREALFDFGENEDAVSPAIWDEVSEGFEAAVRQRLWISQEQFNSWLYGKRAYMLQTVEKGAELGKVDDRRDLVRRAMLEEAWRGFTLVSECLDAFARAFERAIPRPLNETERRLFAVMYRRQPYYGNFVLPLLLDAKDLLEHAVLDLWEAPHEPQAVEIFQRMLVYRSQIIRRVRETQRWSRAAKHHPVLSSSGVEEKTFSKESLWRKLTGHLLEQRAVACPHCNLPPTCTLIHDNATDDTVVVEVGCLAHGPLRELTITQQEFTAAHEAIYGECV